MNTPPQSKCMGFGFQPEESEHHFVVTVPGGHIQDVLIAEHLRFDADTSRAAPSLGMGIQDAKLRVALPRTKWDAIADEARTEFNRRLAKQGLPADALETG